MTATETVIVTKTADVVDAHYLAAETVETYGEQ